MGSLLALATVTFVRGACQLTWAGVKEMLVWCIMCTLVAQMRLALWRGAKARRAMAPAAEASTGAVCESSEAGVWRVLGTCTVVWAVAEAARVCLVLGAAVRCWPWSKLIVTVDASARSARAQANAAQGSWWNTIWGSPRDILGSPEMIDPSVGPDK